MRLKKPISGLSVLALVAGILIINSAGPAAADAAKLTTTQQVNTKMRCRASAPVINWTDADQIVGLTSTYPKYVAQGDTFQVVSVSEPTEVPATQSGVTLNSLSELYTRTLYSGGFTIVSATTVPGTGSYKVNAAAAPSPIPGGVDIQQDATHALEHLPGPFPANSILQPPDLRVTLQATGPVGSTITSRFAGTIPTNQDQSWPDYGFKTTASTSFGAAAASCAPNYGALANGNGETLGTPPLLSSTTIIPSNNPLVSITAPAAGARYLPDAQIFANFACTETVYALVSCESTLPQGTQLDFSQFGVKSFTVTATDANGGVATQTVSYDVGGNVTPTVDAGPDVTVNGGASLTLHGSATDPDTGQVLSYEWTQIAGTPATLNPIDAADPFETDQRIVVPRTAGNLTFRLRVDDGNDTGEDTVVVHVLPNQGPTINNGPAQTINNVKTNATVTVSGAATDPEGDNPVTYSWDQVDADGHALPVDSPLRVTLSAPTAASTSFTAPQGPRAIRLQITATDALGSSAVGDVTVNVVANVKPVITNGLNQILTRTVASNVIMNGAATDADNAAPSANQVISYLWTQVDDQGNSLGDADPAKVALSSSTVPQPSFTAPSLGATLHFTVAVSDGFGTTTGNVSVVVTGNQAPVANAGAFQLPGRGKLVTLDGSASSDPDGNPITYQWTQVDSSGNPLSPSDPLAVTLSPSTVQKPTFTAPVIVGAPQSMYFKLVVTDSFGAPSVAANTTVFLVANQAPTANAGAAQTNKATNSTVTLNGSGSSDPDASDTLTYAWTQVDTNGDPILVGDPTKVPLSSSTVASPTFPAPHFAASTTLRFKLIVTDTQAAPSTSAFTTVQINANRAPAVGAPSVTPASRPIGTTVTVTVPASAADADGDPVAGFTYQWVQTDSAGNACAPTCAVANVTITPVVGTPRSATFVAPAFNVASATLFFRLTVNDGFGATVQSTNLTVALTNTAPVVQFAIRPQGMNPTNVTTNSTTVNQIYTDELVTLDGTANPANTLSTSDADGTAGFTYAWRQVTTSGGNTNCSSNCIFGGVATSSLAQPTFTMPNTAQLFLRLTVTDAFGTASAVTNFTLNRLANTAPTVTATGPAFVNIATTGVQLTGTATDPQTSASPAQTLTRSWTQVDSNGVLLPVNDPMHVTLSSNTSLTPTFDAPIDPGFLFFKLSANDGGVTTSATATIEVVLGNNQTPTADAGMNQTGLKAGQSALLDGSGSSDPEGHTITYAWTQIDGSGNPVTSGPTKVTLSSSTVQKPQFVVPALASATDLHFKLVVTDKYLAVSTPDTVDLSVDPNAAPIANAGPNQSGIKANQSVQLDGSGTTEPEGNTFTYAWTQVDGAGNPIAPTVTLVTGSAQKPTFLAPATGPLTLHFRLVATDQFGLASTPSIVDVAVLANGQPVANAGANQSAAAGASVQLDGSGSSDPDGNTITYAWTQVDGSNNPIAPTVTLVTGSAQKPTFTAPGSPTGTTLRFRLVVTDQFTLASAASFTNVSVAANHRPVANAGPAQTPGRGRLVTLDGSGSSDPDNDTLTYQWVQVDAGGAPVVPGDPLAVSLNDSAAQKPTFTAPTAVLPADLQFRLFVTDTSSALSDPSTVVIHLVVNNAPIANAGPNQTNIATNATVTLNSAASADPDLGDTIIRAWTQVDTNGDPVTSGPTKVPLSSDSAISPTFPAPHFAVSTTLRFQVIVTDNNTAPSAPAFVTVQINANRAPAVGAPTATPASRPRGTTVTVTVPASANDADGDAVAGFTYQWVQTDAAGVACSPGCPVADVTLTPVVGTPRSATFVAPNFTVAAATLRFRLTVSDGFGATAQSTTLAVALTNTNPTVPTPTLKTGYNFQVTNPTTLYVGEPIQLDARAAIDADGFGPDQLVYTFTGQPCTLFLGLLCTGYPGGSCTDDLIQITPDPVVPGKATFTAPPLGPNSPTTCGLRVVVTDPAGGSTTVNWAYTLKQNVGAPVAVISPALPAKINASAPAGDSVLALTASASTDPDTNPTQPLGYHWDQVDPTTGNVVPNGDPSHGVFSNPDSVNTTWTAPASAPHNARFKLSVTDAIALPSTVLSSVVKITSPRPGSNAGPDVLTQPLEQVTLDGTGSTSPNGMALTYSWKQVSGPAVTITNALSPQATITAPSIPLGGDTEMLTFELTARDGLSATFDTMTVLVNPWGPPTADAGASQTVASSATVLLDGTGSSSPAETPLTYTWTQTGGPTVAISAASTAQPAFTAPFVPQSAPGPLTLTFQLVVNDGFGNSAPSTTTVVVNKGFLAPGAPTNVIGAPSGANAVVSFVAPTDNGGKPITSYKASCTQTAGGFPKLGTGAASPVTVAGLVAAKPYTCKVQAVNEVGTGAASVASPVFIAGAPSAPTAVKGVPGAAAATVTWTAGAPNGAAITGYRVTPFIGTVAQPVRVFTTNATSQVITGLTNGTAYTFKVVGVNARGIGRVSAASPAVVVGTPLAPTAVIATAGTGGKATVKWTAPTVTNGAAITGYVVTPFKAGVAQPARVFNTTVVQQLITGLTVGSSYTFKVAAKNARGTGPVSAPSAAVTVH